MFDFLNVSFLLSVVLLISSYAIETLLIPPFYLSHDHYNPRIFKVLPDTISLKACLLAITVIFVLLGVSCQIIYNRTYKYLFRYLYGFIVFLAVLTAISNFLKILLLKERPDFYARCSPDKDGRCMGPARLVIEGYKSFPSGHTLACFGMSFYVLFFMIQNSIHFLILFPIFSAITVFSIFVAVTRVKDYKHSPFDVMLTCLITIALSGLFLGQLRKRFENIESGEEENNGKLPGGE